MNETAYAARILTFDPEGRIVDAARGTFEPQSLHVATGPASRPYADLGAVPVSRVYLGAEPGAASSGTVTALAGIRAADRSYIVVERENGYTQVIEATPAVARQTLDAEPAAGGDLAATRGDVRGVRAESDLGAFLSPDATRVELTTPDYPGQSQRQSMTRYANELLDRATAPARLPGREAPAERSVPEGASVRAWTATLVAETAGATGAADVARLAAKIDRPAGPSPVPETRGAAPSPAAVPATPAASLETPSPAAGGSGAQPPAATPELDRARPPDEPRPDVTPVVDPRERRLVQPEIRGRDVVGDRPAFERVADARLDSLRVKYNQYDIEEKLSSERSITQHHGAAEMAYVRDGAAATAAAGYQQSGRIVEITAEHVVQDIGQHKFAIYDKAALLGQSPDPRALESTLDRAARGGGSVELSVSRSGGLQISDLSQGLGRSQEQQDRGMGRSLF